MASLFALQFALLCWSLKLRLSGSHTKSVTRHTVLWGECSVYNMLPPVTATLFAPNCSCWWHQPTQRNYFQEEHDCDTLFQLPPNQGFSSLHASSSSFSLWLHASSKKMCLHKSSRIHHGFRSSNFSVTKQ